jgi:pimeloyl-ACP methyl ester carboxylesterase
MTERSLVLAAVLLGACSSSEIAPHPIWSSDASKLENPLPDARTNGRLSEMRPGVFPALVPLSSQTPELYAFFDRYAEQISAIDGWAGFATIYLRFSDPPDLSTLLPGAITLLDIERPSDPPMPFDVTWREDPGILEIVPSSPLRPGAEYALVVTDRVTSKGVSYERAEDFDAEARGPLATIVRAAAGALGLPERSIVLAAPFQVQNATKQNEEIAARLATVSPKPDLAPDEDRGRGVFTMEEFRARFPNRAPSLRSAGHVAVGTFPSYDLRSSGTIDPSRGLEEDDVAELDFVLVEPDPARHPPPWKTVILQHGFNGSREFVLDLAEDYVSAGLAVIGIDAVSHGARGVPLSFINLEDVRKMRDAFRQTAFDLIQLDRMARTSGIDVDGLPGPDLDGRVDYFGHSMGAIIGSLFVEIAPGDRTAIINAGGGGFRIIFTGEAFAEGVEILLRGALGFDLEQPGYDPVQPILFNVAQVIFERADPVVHARLAKPALAAGAPRRLNLLLQEGAGDRFLTNRATRALAKELDLAELSSTTESSEGVNGLWRVDQSAFGVPSDEDPHGIYFNIPGVRRQAVEYFRSNGTRVIDPASR